LEPAAGLALQLAALFHDVERLETEAEARVEQHAANYQVFKDAHALRGAAIAEAALARAGVDPETRRQAADLIAGHETPRGSEAADLALLNDADALSFFSLNSPGYLDYYGPEQTRRKVAYTLKRLRPESRRHLAAMRLPARVAEFLAEDSAARERVA
jgi:predicted metal-dependent HD superfamily phosphohydrolase